MEEKELAIEQQTVGVEVITTETESLSLEGTWQWITDEGKSKPIVVTGFGMIDKWSGPNFSEAIMKNFYKDHGGKFQGIDIVTGPWHTPKAIPVRYSYVNGKEFDGWLRSSDARLYVHLGETTRQASLPNPLFLEKQAKNCPGKDPETGKCGWTTENRENNGGKKCEELGEDILKTSFDISSVIDEVGSKILVGDSEHSITPIKSCDAGTSLCDFLYYRSLYYAKERGHANVLFIHVPHREEANASKIYVAVLNKVIKCLLLKQTASPQSREQISLDIDSTPLQGELEESVTTKCPPCSSTGQEDMPYVEVQPRRGQRSTGARHECDPPVYADPVLLTSQSSEDAMYSYPAQKKQPPITAARHSENDCQGDLYTVPQQKSREPDHDPTQSGAELSYATVSQKTGKRATHTKKQVRESRRRRRQKRNARLRNRK